VPEADTRGSGAQSAVRAAAARSKSRWWSSQPTPDPRWKAARRRWSLGCSHDMAQRNAAQPRGDGAPARVPIDAVAMIPSGRSGALLRRALSV
jgi:hypothetical protein